MSAVATPAQWRDVDKTLADLRDLSKKLHEAADQLYMEIAKLQEKGESGD
ncbi:MAG TPA: hypothetical protein VFM55_18895 [Micromonosporaceae bacterium]|nr:hypothetical protein [Micromonosporaceae bacterium]